MVNNKQQSECGDLTYRLDLVAADGQLSKNQPAIDQGTFCQRSTCSRHGKQLVRPLLPPASNGQKKSTDLSIDLPFCDPPLASSSKLESEQAHVSGAHHGVKAATASPNAQPLRCSSSGGGSLASPHAGSCPGSSSITSEGGAGMSMAGGSSAGMGTLSRSSQCVSPDMHEVGPVSSDAPPANRKHGPGSSHAEACVGDQDCSTFPQQPAACNCTGVIGSDGGDGPVPVINKQARKAAKRGAKAQRKRQAQERCVRAASDAGSSTHVPTAAKQAAHSAAASHAMCPASDSSVCMDGNEAAAVVAHLAACSNTPAQITQQRAAHVHTTVTQPAATAMEPVKSPAATALELVQPPAATAPAAACCLPLRAHMQCITVHAHTRTPPTPITTSMCVLPAASPSMSGHAGLQWRLAPFPKRMLLPPALHGVPMLLPGVLEVSLPTHAPSLGLQAWRDGVPKWLQALAPVIVITDSRGLQAEGFDEYPAFDIFRLPVERFSSWQQYLSQGLTKKARYNVLQKSAAFDAALASGQLSMQRVRLDCTAVTQMDARAGMHGMSDSKSAMGQHDAQGKDCVHAQAGSSSSACWFWKIRASMGACFGASAAAQIRKEDMLVTEDVVPQQQECSSMHVQEQGLSGHVPSRTGSSLEPGKSGSSSVHPSESCERLRESGKGSSGIGGCESLLHAPHQQSLPGRSTDHTDVPDQAMRYSRSTLAEELWRLYSSTGARNGFVECCKAVFMEAVRDRPAPGSEVLLVRDCMDGRLLAFSLLVPSGDTLMWLYTGVDYDHPLTTHAYCFFNIVYEAVRAAIHGSKEGGIRWLDMGPGRRFVKLQGLGAEAHPVSVYVRVRGSRTLSRALMSKYFKPQELLNDP